MTDVSGKNWYIVHTYSGFEKKVAESLQQRVQAYGLKEEIGEVLIPTEDIVEKRGGREVKSSRRFGSKTAATVGTPSISSATVAQKMGMPCA